MDKILETVLFLAFSVLILIVTFQVLSRFLPISFIWTEELSRFLFIYAISLGAPLAIKRNEFINVEMAINKLPKTVKGVYETVIHLVTIVLMLIIGIKGIDFASLGVTQQSATMPVPMAIPYASISISAFLMALYSILNIFDKLKTADERGDRQ